MDDSLKMIFLLNAPMVGNAIGIYVKDGDLLLGNVNEQVKCGSYIFDGFLNLEINMGLTELTCYSETSAGKSQVTNPTQVWLKDASVFMRVHDSAIGRLDDYEITFFKHDTGE